MHIFHVCWCAQDEKFAYLQFTVRFWTTHTFAAYDAKGRLVAGDPDRPLPVRPPPVRLCRAGGAAPPGAWTEQWLPA